MQERRLLTGSNNGELKMWNFNSGSQLRQFVHNEEHVEYSVLLFIHDADRQSNLVSQEARHGQLLLQELVETTIQQTEWAGYSLLGGH